MSQDFDSYNSIPAAFFAIAERHPKSLVYTQSSIEGLTLEGEEISNVDALPRTKRDFRFAEVSARVLRVAAFLKTQGVAPGSRVAIVSNSRGEWLEADLAALSVGAVVVSVYQSLRANDIGYILYDSGADVVFAENQEQVDKLLDISSRSVPIPATEDRPGSEATLSFRAIISFEPVKRHEGVTQYESIVAGNSDNHIPDIVREITRDSLATLVYTSGTTGPPKGVMQTHGNHLANVRQAKKAGICSDDARIMVFLPLAHSFAKLMGYIGFISLTSIIFPAAVSRRSSKIDPRSLSRDIRESEATIVPIVPRFLEKMQAAIVQKSTKGGLQGNLLKLMLWAAHNVYEVKHRNARPAMFASLLHGMFEPLRQKVRADLFGKSFQYAISGGAKLPVSVNEFFDALDIEILEGYGLTETCVATNINRPGKKKIGSVGPVLADDIEMKLADDGEIIFRGPNITSGYYNRPTATSSAWNAEGWFHTGDLGRVEDGVLYIVGRKKELICTAGGKKIAVENIEQQIKASPFISQVIMVGEGRPYCIALVTLDEPAIKSWAAKNGSAVGTAFSKDEKVTGLIWSEVEKVNKNLASFESIKKVAILDEEFTVENELLTPTFKLKRAPIEKRYRDLIEDLYSKGGVRE